MEINVFEFEAEDKKILHLEGCLYSHILFFPPPCFFLHVA